MNGRSKNRQKIGAGAFTGPSGRDELAGPRESMLKKKKGQEYQEAVGTGQTERKLSSGSRRLE